MRVNNHAAVQTDYAFWFERRLIVDEKSIRK